jgi:hypothetical protein
MNEAGRCVWTRTEPCACSNLRLAWYCIFLSFFHFYSITRHKYKRNVPPRSTPIIPNNLLIYAIRNWNISVCIVGPPLPGRTGNWRFGCRQGEEIHHSPKRPEPTHPRMQQVTIMLSPGSKRSKCETDHSHPSNAEIKHAWSCPSRLHACTGTAAPFCTKWYQWKSPYCHTGSCSNIPASQHSHVFCHVYRMIHKKTSYGNYRHFYIESMRTAYFIWVCYSTYFRPIP